MIFFVIFSGFFEYFLTDVDECTDLKLEKPVIQLYFDIFDNQIIFYSEKLLLEFGFHIVLHTCCEQIIDEQNIVETHYDIVCFFDCLDKQIQTIFEVVLRSVNLEDLKERNTIFNLWCVVL